MSDRSKSLTCNFLLPLLGKPHKWYIPSLSGVYLIDETQPELSKEGRLYLLFSNSSSFDQLILALRALSGYVIDYKVSEFETMVAIDLPPSFIADYRKFMAGKYSQMSDAAKALILDNSKPDGINAKILRRDPSLKAHWEERLGTTLPESAEVYTRPIIENETYYGIKEGESSL